MKYIGLDIETTGLSQHNDHVIEVAIILFDDKEIIDEWSSLVKPPVPIPAFTTHLTGITDEMVADAPTLDSLHATILEKLGQYPIVGHFIPFDVNFLIEKGFPLKNQMLDTCQLSQAFLLKESSYSLEVLAEKLNLPQVEAHRALYDVQANIHLFWRLRDHVKALSVEEKESLKPILQKTEWSWSRDILSWLDETGGELIKEDDISASVPSETHADLTELTKDLSPPFLLEEGSHTGMDLLKYALGLDGKVLLVVPDPRALPFDKELGLLKHPDQYLDENRFEQFLAQKKLSDSEALFAIRLSLWLANSQTGDRGEIRLVKEENNLWYDICCQENEEGVSFFKKAEDAAQAKNVMAVSHVYFLKDRSRKQPLLHSSSHTVIGRTEEILGNLEQAWHIRLSESRFIEDLRRLKKLNPDQSEILDSLASKVSILFGFLGMMVRKYGVPNDPRHSLVVETFHLNSTEWNHVKGSAESIEAITAALGNELTKSPLLEEFSRYLSYLTKILRLASPILWLSFTQDEQPIVHAFPENPADLFRERVWKDAGELHFFAHHASVKGKLDFLKSQLALPAELSWEPCESLIPYPVYFPEEKVSSPKDPKNIHEVTAVLKKWIPEQEKNILILVNSQAVGEQLFYQLKPWVKETDLNLFVQNMSGGMGKIFKMAEKTDGKNIFVGNESFMKFLLDQGVELKNMAFHRLPFSSPNDPIHMARCQIYGSNSYDSYSLPKAVLHFHNILGTFLGNVWDDKKILLLDPRMQELVS